MSDKKYTLIILTFFVISLMGIGGFNYLVDPFEIFNSTKVAGFNQYKPESDRRQRLSKTYVIEKNCPEALIMGNSRALAIPSNYAAWPYKDIYNFAISSTSMYETYRHLQHAIASCKIKAIVLSVDFLMFEKNAGHAAGFKENRLKVTSKGNPTNWRIKAKLQDSVPALLSLTAFKASLRTVRKQKQIKESTAHCSSPQKEHYKIKNKGGHHLFMMETNRRTLKKFNTNHDPAYYNSSLNYYRNFLELAHNNNIKVILMIPPSHASLYETLFHLKVKNHFNNWVKKIIYINENVSLALDKSPYNIFNFSGYNSITTEKVPHKNAQSIGMNWFWESLHFKKELSYHILDRIFDHERPNCPTPKDFGLKINSLNLKNYNLSQQKERIKYLKKYN